MGRSVHIDQADFSETRFVFKLPRQSIEGRAEGGLASRHCSESPEAASVDVAEDLAIEGEVPVKEENCQVGGTYQTDEDGDLVVCRKNAQDPPQQVITIVHAMGTDLSMVGQQVWLGALLLCDFLVHYHSLLEGRVVLDLGAGVGLTSIVAALHASTVFCTVYRGKDILNLARVNVERNSDLLQNADIQVRQLDWKADKALTASPESADVSETFRFSGEDIETLSTCSVILAAEVIYDLDLTDAFFCMLHNFLVQPPAKCVYMTVEKRLVFTTADRDVVSPAYDHFRELLQELCAMDNGPVRFLCSCIDLSFPQYFHYQRTKELELWKIETVFVYHTKGS
ncbi:hypothetical protein ACOMHN_026789 [Nucella lapillus]